MHTKCVVLFVHNINLIKFIIEESYIATKKNQLFYHNTELVPIFITNYSSLRREYSEHQVTQQEFTKTS